jgi:uncharacterized phage protein (TIGR01671 family)
MREIKFRAWLFLQKEMLYESLYGAEKFGGRDCEIMQYTGLNDKNGKEIYEGDIVTCVGGYDTPEGVYDSCEDARFIQFSEETLQFVAHCENCRESLPLYEFDYEEIIGNIYENPELLHA